MTEPLIFPTHISFFLQICVCACLSVSVYVFICLYRNITEILLYIILHLYLNTFFWWIHDIRYSRKVTGQLASRLESHLVFIQVVLILIRIYHLLYVYLCFFFSFFFPKITPKSKPRVIFTSLLSVVLFLFCTFCKVLRLVFALDCFAKCSALLLSRKM